MPTSYLLAANLSSFPPRLAGAARGRHDPSFPRPYSLEGDTNDETANPGRTFYVRSVRCRGGFFGDGPGSVFERRKAQPARNSIQRRGHLDRRWG
jgi:hypothetical protein